MLKKNRRCHCKLCSDSVDSVVDHYLNLLQVRLLMQFSRSQLLREHILTSAIFGTLFKTAKRTDSSLSALALRLIYDYHFENRSSFS